MSKHEAEWRHRRPAGATVPLTISIAGYLVVAVVVWGTGRWLGRWIAVVAALPYIIHLAVVAWLARSDGHAIELLEWIPDLGVAIGLRQDAMTWILTAVVAGIGLLIVIYSHGYFADEAKRASFLAWLLVFTAGMAGVVSSDELFGLFVFWEITTVASYLLIGFDHQKAAARASALQAILVTTSGGLAMLAGFVLLTMEGGTTSISELVANPPTGTATSVALGLVFLGAFTKSAQFPFHFWLPGAMAAPTPASAYLHSATMVKAGIVLLLFLAPGFAETGIWLWTVTTVGLLTMVVGAVAALRQFDLKLLLAYGTVSQLGFMVALIGLGHTAAALAVLVAHSLFKAAMFLIVGYIDKATGTRDVRVLNNIGSRFKGLAVAGAVAAASMAGVPPMLGFVTKEAAFDLLIKKQEWVPLAVIAGASILTVAYAGLWWFGAFGPGRTEEPLQAKRKSPFMIVGPILLATLTVVFGLFPASLGSAVSEATGESIKLVLWPGLKPALALSTLVLASGLGVFSILRRRGIEMLPTARDLHLPTGDGVYAWSLRTLNLVADTATGVVQSGSLPKYIAVTVSAVLFIPSMVWAFNWDAAISAPWFHNPAEPVLAVVVSAGAYAATRVQRRMAAALLLGVVGYAVTGIYVVYSAPDVALTQLLIETLTVALFALVLSKLPRRFGEPPRSLSRAARIAVAAFAGVFATAAALIVTTVDKDESVVAEYLSGAEAAGGTNVVNVILTNFRAMDTLGEITVLAAAGVGIAALVGSVRRQRTEDGP